MKYPHINHRPRQHGFTLIELMITVAIVGILASIAMPSYASYVKKAKIRAAQADLVALVMNMEQRYTATMSYPSPTTTTSDTQTLFGGWAPATSNDFKFVIDSSSSSSYTLKAIGTSNVFNNCQISITSANSRSVDTNCGIGTTSWL